MKHTIPSSHPFASIFTTASTSDYAGYIVITANSGSVEIDSRGRRNIIWVAGRPTGFSYVGGVLSGPADGVKVVLSSEATKVHAFPVNTASLKTEQCAQCGVLVST